MSAVVSDNPLAELAQSCGLTMKRREVVKARHGDSNFLEKEDKQGEKALKALRPIAVEADPFFSIQAMETMLGHQRMEMHRLIHGYHETAMRFLLRKEEDWRRSEMESKDLKSHNEALKKVAGSGGMGLDSPIGSKGSKDLLGSGDSKSTFVLNVQLEKTREQLLECEKQHRFVQAENFELREQLAAMQAVGAGYGGILSQNVQSPMWNDMSWAVPNADFAPPMHEKTADGLPVKGTVTSFLEKLSTTQSNPLDRLERAQSKLDAWAASHHPRPDPALQGLAASVDYSTMELPGTDEVRPEIEDKATTNDQEDEDIAIGYIRSGKKKKKKDNKRRSLMMKDRVQELFDKPINVKDKYKTTGITQKIVRSPWFENTCMAVIFLNAIWIGIEMSFNPAEVLAYADPPFIIVENLFCVFFFAEIVLRLHAFSRMCNAFRDRWFVFDLTLVILMVIETWLMFLIMTVSTDTSQSQEQAFDSSVLRLLKLSRLTRVARIARLLRQVPEVMILLKGIGVASRSVFFTCLILLSVIYIFSIALTQLSEGTPLGTAYFPTLVDGMFSLLFHACFFQGLPDLARLCFQENFLYGLSLLVFVVLAPLTVMNLIVGVLVEVVGVVAAAEQEASTRNAIFEALQEALERLGPRKKEDVIARGEFAGLVNRPDLVGIFLESGIDVVAILRDPDMVFAGEAEMSITEFLEETIALRGSNPATVRDLGQLKLQTLGARWNAVISNALRVHRFSAEDPSRNANTRSATHADFQVGTEPSGREPVVQAQDGAGAGVSVDAGYMDCMRRWVHAPASSLLPELWDSMLAQVAALRHSSLAQRHLVAILSLKDTLVVANFRAGEERDTAGFGSAASAGLAIRCIFKVADRVVSCVFAIL
ncbi:CACNA1E [Symbiodinium sp. CCMP2456]|nr:CACNA1E [Symbiodinium sp. CCMP2456]